jgi:hypothetical protein
MSRPIDWHKHEQHLEQKFFELAVCCSIIKRFVAEATPESISASAAEADSKEDEDEEDIKEHASESVNCL